jgi:protein TonB
MQTQGGKLNHVQNLLISLSGHVLCLILIFGVPSCRLFRRPKKPEHKIYTFDLIDPSVLSMKKTKGSPISAKKKSSAKKPVKAAPKKKKPKKKTEKKKKSKKKSPKKKAAPKKKKAKKARKKKPALPKKTIEDKIKEQLKKIDESGAKKWVEADKADTLTKDKVAEQGIAGLLNTGDFTNVSYNDAVASLIYQTWQPPSKTPSDKEGATVTVRFKIARGGVVSRVRIEKKSGSEVLDNSALQAIRDASPLPPLPEDYKGDVLEVCMTFVPILDE